MNMPRFPKHKPSDFILNEEARTILQQADMPPTLRQSLRLQMAGGRKQKRRCAGCGGRAIHCQTEVPPEAWRIESPADTRVRVYWLCHLCFTREQAEASRKKE